MRSRRSSRSTRGSLPDRAGRGVAGRAERLAQDDEPDAVVEQDLEPDLVDEGGHAGECLVGGDRLSPRRFDLLVGSRRPAPRPASRRR